MTPCCDTTLQSFFSSCYRTLLHFPPMMKSSKTFADHGPWIHQLLKWNWKNLYFPSFFLLAFYFYFMYLYLELFLVFLELLWSVSMTISAWFLLVYTYIFRIIFIFFRTSVKPNWAFLWKLRYMCRSLLVFLFYKIHSLWPELWLAAATNKNESWLVNSEVCVLLKSTVIYLDVNGVRKLTINALIFFWKGAKEDPNRHF